MAHLRRGGTPVASNGVGGGGPRAAEYRGIQRMKNSRGAGNLGASMHFCTNRDVCLLFDILG